MIKLLSYQQFAVHHSLGPNHLKLFHSLLYFSDSMFEMISITKCLQRLCVPRRTVALRTLFTARFLQLDAMENRREMTRARLEYSLERYWKRMARYYAPGNSMCVTSQEIASAIQLASTPEHAESLLKLCRFYLSQCHKFQLFNYGWGSPFMRVMHLLRQPDMAMEVCFDEDLDIIMGASATFLVATDLMFECERYEDVLRLWDRFKERCKRKERAQALTLARNHAFQIIITAACYKLATQKSFDYASEYIKFLTDNDAVLQRRSAAFMVGLSLKLGDVDAAYVFLSMMHKSMSCCLGRSLNVLVSVKRAKIGSAIVALEQLLQTDGPVTNMDRLISVQALDELSTFLSSDNNLSLQEQKRCDRLLLLVKDGRCVLEQNIDELIMRPVSEDDVEATNMDILLDSTGQQEEENTEPVEFDDPELATLDDCFVRPGDKARFEQKITQSVAQKIRNEGPFGVAQ